MGMKGLDGSDYKGVAQDSSFVKMEPFYILRVVVVTCLYI